MFIERFENENQCEGKRRSEIGLEKANPLMQMLIVEIRVLLHDAHTPPMRNKRKGESNLLVCVFDVSERRERKMTL